MNYEPNTVSWARGDIVIHDADAKEPHMLMKIIGFTRKELAKCQYVDRNKKRTVYANDLMYLHAPEIFGLNYRWGYSSQKHLQRVQSEFELMCHWNRLYHPGQRILTTSADGGFEAVTTAPAFMYGGGDARIRLRPGGEWLLRFVEALNV